LVRPHADRLLAAPRAVGVARWTAYLEPLPERFRDASVPEVRSVALRARAAYGPKDSIRDALPAELTEPFREAVDRLLKVLARNDLER
jgi:hypothetical protein